MPASGFCIFVVFRNKAFCARSERIVLVAFSTNPKHRFELLSATYGKTAVAEQQRHNQNQAARIYVEVEAFHLSAAAAQKQDNEQNPSAVASTKAAAAFFAAATAVAIVEHSVEHFYLLLPKCFGMILTCQSLLHNMEFFKNVLQSEASNE